MTDITSIMKSVLLLSQLALWLVKGRDPSTRWDFMNAWAAVSLANLMLGVEITAPVSADLVGFAERIALMVMAGITIALTGHYAYSFVRRRWQVNGH